MIEKTERGYKMAIVDVVKYNGTNDVFAWKYPSDSLSTWTQLIVGQSQEAVVYKEGQALDVFTNGRYVLDTDNIPILRRFMSLPFGGKTPFTAEVWYINKIYSLDIKWGTPSPVQVTDPKYKIFVPVRSYGQFGVRVEDSRKFLQKLVGTVPRFDKRNLVDYFRGLYITKIKDTLSSYFQKKQISVLEINAYIDEISDCLKEKIAPIMSEYGLELINFYVNDVNVPEDDLAVKRLKAALAKKAEMEIIGYDYTQERSFDALEGVGKNASTAATVGMEIGSGLGSAIGGIFQGIAQNINIEEQKLCPKCASKVKQTARFCGHCGFGLQKEASILKKEEKKGIVCSECSAVYNENAKFCPECGKKYRSCPSCKADVKEGAVSCEKCGHQFGKLCPKCGQSIDIHAKFCPECGMSLIKICSNCHAQVKPTAKFCPECGASLKEESKKDVIQ